MGTRADFYVGRGETAEWLGSVAFDGYPGGVFDDAPELFGEPLSETHWRNWVTEYLAGRDDSTTPEQGWPWPWDNSRTTDYAHALDDGAIWSSCFGHEWFRADPAAENYGEPDDSDGPKTAVFPDMSERKNVTYGTRSGAIFLTLPADGAS